MEGKERHFTVRWCPNISQHLSHISRLYFTFFLMDQVGIKGNSKWFVGFIYHFSFSLSCLALIIENVDLKTLKNFPLLFSKQTFFKSLKIKYKTRNIAVNFHKYVSIWYSLFDIHFFPLSNKFLRNDRYPNVPRATEDLFKGKTKIDFQILYF